MASSSSSPDGEPVADSDPDSSTNTDADTGTNIVVDAAASVGMTSVRFGEPFPAPFSREGELRWMSSSSRYSVYYSNAASNSNAEDSWSKSDLDEQDQQSEQDVRLRGAHPLIFCSGIGVQNLAAAARLDISALMKAPFDPEQAHSDDSDMNSDSVDDIDANIKNNDGSPMTVEECQSRSFGRKTAGDLQACALGLIRRFVEWYQPATEHWLLGDLWHGSRVALFDVHDVDSQDLSLVLTRYLSTSDLERLVAASHPERQLIRARVYAVSGRTDLDWDGTPLQSVSDRAKKEREIHARIATFRRCDWLGYDSRDGPDTPKYDKVRRIVSQACIGRNNYTILPEVNKLASQSSIDEDDSSVVSSQEDASVLWRLPTNPNYLTTIEVHNESTLAGVQALARHFDERQNERVGWLNLANAYNTCGSYNVPFRGSQEECTATASDGCALLGWISHHHGDSAFRNLALKHSHVKYDQHWNVPRAGAISGEVQFLLANNSVDFVNATMICVAFADFRPSVPFQGRLFGQANGERAEFFDRKGRIKDLSAYFRRCREDVSAAVLSAIDAGVTHFVAGASGCGAFLHEPNFEAALWRDVLTEFDGYFRTVRFSILGGTGHLGRDSANFLAFESLFGSSTFTPPLLDPIRHWHALERDILTFDALSELHRRMFSPQKLRIKYQNSWKPFRVVCFDGEVLYSALLPCPVPSRQKRLVICFGGNGEAVDNQVSSPDSRASMLARVLEASVLCVEYRGYGGMAGSSSQRPMMFALLNDVHAIFSAVRSSPVLGHSPDQVVVFGRSMGSRVALCCAHAYPSVKGVILDSALADPSELPRFVLGARLPHNHRGFDLLNDIQGEHRHTLTSFRGSVLILHAADDKIHPISCAESLFKWATRSNAVLAKFDDAEEGNFGSNMHVLLGEIATGGHNYIWTQNREVYESWVKKFADNIAENPLPFASMKIETKGE